MIEAIAHLIHRDYSEIGQDFINLDFIPPGTYYLSYIHLITIMYSYV